MLDAFKLPIEYSPGHLELDKSLRNDLELDEAEEQQGLHMRLVNGDDYMRLIQGQLARFYTTDENFLAQTQSLLSKQLPESKVSTDMINVWRDVIGDEAFYERFQYIETPALEFVNRNAKLLQALGVYNIASPILALALPILLLIIPFFIIKLQGHDISISKYIEVLKLVTSRHSLGQLFSFQSVGWNQRIYILFSLALYAVQVYNNVISCVRFVRNVKVMKEHLRTLDDYLSTTIPLMRDVYGGACNGLSEYDAFTETGKEHLKMLEHVKHCLEGLTSMNRGTMSMATIGELGRTLRCFYMLHRDPNVSSSLEYSMKFHGWLRFISSLSNQLQDGRLGTCTFTDTKDTKFTGAYFAGVNSTADVKANDYGLSKNIIITGPNASGKTTILKATLFNYILSQQFGVGCYQTGRVRIVNKFHCYLNIPDTSGRDSLFQAEARRCMEILEATQDTEQRHFCIFDELYSGTNPYEAIASATALLEEINSRSNVRFMLTTHFTRLCHNLKKSDMSSNKHMGVNESEDKLQYTYTLEAGVSSVRGGVQVLKDLRYPTKLVCRANRVLKTIRL